VADHGLRVFTDTIPTSANCAPQRPRHRPADPPALRELVPQFIPPRMASGLVRRLPGSASPRARNDPAGLLQAMTITVSRQDDGKLVAAARDGRRWPLFEFFAVPIAWFGSELFKLNNSPAAQPEDHH